MKKLDKYFYVSIGFAVLMVIFVGIRVYQLRTPWREAMRDLGNGQVSWVVNTSDGYYNFTYANGREIRARKPDFFTGWDAAMDKCGEPCLNILSTIIE